MRSIIEQSVVFPATAETLFDMYVNPELHGAVTGAPVTMSEAPGSEFRAFDGALFGTTLAVVRPRLVVQSWRSVSLKEEDADTTLILSFSPNGDGGRVDLVHLDVPEHDYNGVTNGWNKYYWEQWRAYLAK